MVQQTQIRLKKPIGIVLLLLSSCFLFFSCTNSIEEVNKISRTSNEPIDIARDIEFVHTDSGRIKYQMNAPVIYTFAGTNPRKVWPSGVKMQFFSADENPETQLTAGYAVNFEGKGRMEARINVIVINEKGETLKTEHLIWEEKTKRIFTDKFVTITTKDEILYGDGLESNQEFTKYRIKNIKGIIQVKE